MFECMKKIKWGKALLASLIFLVISFIIRQVESLLMMNYYIMPQYFGVWSKLMMPKAGPPEMPFFVTSLIFSFITGLTLALVYFYMKDSFPKGFWTKVINFTDIVIGLSFVFFTLPVYLMFNIPLGLLISWLISSFIIFFLGSMVFVRMLK